jgi:solute carrier family 25 S-adenosylmethionine transporter 26
MSGCVSAAIAATITNPLDVIKTRIMTRGFNGLRNAIQTEGYSLFLKGIGPRVLWISIGGFVFLGTYEKVRSMYDNTWAPAYA